MTQAITVSTTTHNTTVDKIHKTHISKRKKVQKPKQEGGWGMLYSCTHEHWNNRDSKRKEERKLPGCSGVRACAYTYQQLENEPMVKKKREGNGETCMHACPRLE